MTIIKGEFMEKLRKPEHPGKVFFLDVLVPLKLSVTEAARMMYISDSMILKSG